MAANARRAPAAAPGTQASEPALSAIAQQAAGGPPSPAAINHHKRISHPRTPGADPPHLTSPEVVMNRIRRITVTLAGLATAVLAFTAASPAAFAIRVPPPPRAGKTGQTVITD
jgi:hypothetical protein